ncbi:PREDICTED: 4-coumarate--CoA ligase 1-like [Nicrophorus vespilloides]|uniref:4-coumarate--CoA ligase 1-like n=1 Tax=Nicrophorus vespilloides TaxID=110193 RepID=A0ABM1MMI7_NICVS|nr:PREDICTED: 4-coumarate--CoA ligase 1-like [Nicrophorus vespilloides]
MAEIDVLDFIEKEEWSYDESTKVITMPEEDFTPNPRGLGYAMFEGMKNNLNKVAQIDAATGQEDLYSEFLQRCVRVSLEMKNRGVKARDFISSCSRNHLNSYIPYVASAFVGTQLAAIDPGLSLVDKKYLINDSKPVLIFVDEGSESVIKEILKELELDTIVVCFDTDFEEFLKPKPDEDKFAPYEPEDISETAVVLFSSGTTGMPKGICLSHKYILFFSRNCNFEMTLAYASLYYISITIIMAGSTINGTTRLICDGFKEDKTWIYIEKYKVNYLFVTPYQTVRLYDAKPEGLVSSLSFMIMAGHQATAEFLDTIRKAMPNTLICYVYGQTELSVIGNPLHALIKDNPTSIGVPTRGMHYKIVDPETEEALALTQKGELRVKSQWTMNGYLNRDNSEVFDKDGFLKTGDVAYFDENFCLYIVDRVKEMFKFRGMHYVPAKVEAILQNHPQIQVATVIGVPNFRDENHAMAVVVLVKGSTITAQEIEEYVNGQVEENLKLRAGVEIIEEMPFTVSGKVSRRCLKEKFVKNDIYH